MVYGVLMPLSTIFQLYRGMAFSFIGGNNRGVPGESHQPAASH